MVFAVIVGAAWTIGIFVKAWADCGGDFGGYGAGANSKLDAVCEEAHSRGAYAPAFVVPLVTAGVLAIVRSWLRRPTSSV
jgi:hypothetical protein